MKHKKRAELAEKINSGNRECFNRIMKEYSPRIYNFILGMVHDPPAAEDLSQEVFLKLWKYRKRYKPKAKLSTFLFTIASNTVRDYFRRSRKKKTLSIENTGMPVSAESPEEPLDVEVKEKLRQAVDNLPDNQREALILKTYEGYSYKEISGIMGISRSAVESLLFRARRNIKKIFK